MSTTILIFKSMKKAYIFNSNKKWKVKSELRDSNPHHSVGQFRYRRSVTLYPLGHLVQERNFCEIYLNVLNKTLNELFFLIRKMLYKISFYHRVGLDCIIFNTKHFGQKHVLTGCINFTVDIWSTEYENYSFEKSISWFFCAFLLILLVYDF